MSEGQIIRDLLKSHFQKDEEGFRRAAKDLIARERSLNHRVFADDLERMVYGGRNGISNKTTGLDIPKDKEKGFPLLHLSRPEIPWERLIIPAAERQQLEDIATENRKSDLLRSAGIPPKQKVLFVGPPGCGKTLAASVLSSGLCWPLATIRLDTVVSSLLGETATNLRRIFEFVRLDRLVVLFDEFDSLGKERNNQDDHGELQRVVAAFLQLIDSYEGESILVFATNHQRLLDSALWRRFDSILLFGLPKEQDRFLMLRQYFRAFHHSDDQLKFIAKSTSGLSGSDLEWLSKEIIRRLLLSNRMEVEKSDIDHGMIQLRHRCEALGNLKMKRGTKRTNRGNKNAA